MNKIYLIKFVCFTLFLTGLPRGVCSEFVWVVNPSVVETKVDKIQLKKVLLGKSLRWSNGDKVIIATLLSADYSYDLIKLYSGKTPRQFLNHWKKLVFVGKGNLPKLFHSDEEILRYVAKTPGAIGCVHFNSVGEDVKLLTIED